MARVQYSQQQLQKLGLTVKAEITLSSSVTEEQQKEIDRLYEREQQSKPGKIRNATKTVVDGIEFDSRLEASVYGKLKLFKIPFELKPSFVLDEGFVYRKRKIGRMVHTPDFYLPSVDMILEVKGHQNDRYSMYLRFLKKKFASENKDTAILFLRTEKDLSRLISLLLSAGPTDVLTQEKKIAKKELEYEFGVSIHIQSKREERAKKLRGEE